MNRQSVDRGTQVPLQYAHALPTVAGLEIPSGSQASDTTTCALCGDTIDASRDVPEHDACHRDDCDEVAKGWGVTPNTCSTGDRGVGDSLFSLPINLNAVVD